ncbi:MAG: hypothetical protein HXY23_00910 [Parvularculaceae bacterium]|jgi:hypothetical protein|nr:hypothetical protein [Parvularculaceae bacterium]
MSWTFVAAALAAMSATVLPDNPPQATGAIARETPEAAKSAKLLVALAATAAAMTIAEDSGETLEIYPLKLARTSRDRGPQLQIGGVGLSLAAYRSKAPSDPMDLVNFRSETRAMGKFMPGYPQPAKVVIGLKVSF